MTKRKITRAVSIGIVLIGVTVAGYGLGVTVGSGKLL